jgi:cell division transport system permease protein
MALRVRYFMGESLSNLRRNLLMTLAAMSTVAVSLFLLGAVVVVGHVVKQVVGSWEEKVEINVFLKDDIAQDQSTTLGKDLVGMPEVSKVDYVSKEQAYEEYKEMFSGSPQLVQNVDPAALPASFRVKLKDPSQVDAVRVRIEGRPGVEQVTYGGDVIKRLLRIIGLLRSITLVMTLILLGAAILLIANTIRLAVYARRREIGIMKLVGATNWFVRVPFIFEGIVEAGVGALMAASVIYLGKAVVLDKVQEQIPFLPLSVELAFVAKVFALLLGVGVFVGAMGSTIALRRHLEV